MKVRMHEKAKKKTAEKYSVEQLLEKVKLTAYIQTSPRSIFSLKCVFIFDRLLHVFHHVIICCVVQTEEYMDSFDFEMAGLFCQRALDVESNNLQALDMLGHIYSELGNTQKAKEISFIKVSYLLLCACHMS